jgi:excisionase family DNA binding protein
MFFLGVPEVSKMLHLQPDTIRKKAAAKSINGVKIGKAWRFTQEDIEAFVSKCRNGITKKGDSLPEARP